MSALHVACAARSDYVPHTAAMLDSVLGHADGLAVHVHYLHGSDVGERTRARLAGMVERGGAEIAFLQVPGELVAGLPSRAFPESVWYRIFLPDLRPDLERILYLDADTLAVDSLRPLWETPLREHPLAAVTNVFQPGHHRAESLGIPREHYINSGVLLMNLEQMRREGTTEALRRRAMDPRGGIRWADQDVLSVVIGDRRLPLHPRWNAMNSVLQFSWADEVFGPDAVAEARRRPGIRHFEGPSHAKPWHILSEMPMRDAYFEHRRRTPWPRVKRAGITPANVVRRIARELSRPRAASAVSA